MFQLWSLLLLSSSGLVLVHGWSLTLVSRLLRHDKGGKLLSFRQRLSLQRYALSGNYLENDLVAIQRRKEENPRLCAVKPDGSVVPLCRREEDVETDLFCDPREYSSSFWTDEVTDDNVRGTYGEGFYGQRPVPSLGGGPGYGAEADEIWSVREATLENVQKDGVDLPVLDMGIAHGERARAGAF